MTTEMSNTSTTEVIDLRPLLTVNENSDGYRLVLNDLETLNVTREQANFLMAIGDLKRLAAAWVRKDIALAVVRQERDTAESHRQTIVDIVCEQFWAEADRRGWCSEAQEFMEQLQHRLEQANIPVTVNTGTKKFTVEWTELWEVRRSVEVEAANEDEAKDKALDEYVGESDFSDLRYESWDYKDYADLSAEEE